MKVDDIMASTLGWSLLSHALQGVFLLTWPPNPLVLLCSFCKFLPAWVCCYSNLKMETLKLPMPLVLMQQVPVKVSWLSSTVPIAHISSAQETLQSRTSLMSPSKQNAIATFSLQSWLFHQDCGCGEANTLCCFYSKSNKLVEIGPVQGWEACMDCGSLFGRKS